VVIAGAPYRWMLEIRMVKRVLDQYFVVDTDLDNGNVILVINGVAFELSIPAARAIAHSLEDHIEELEAPDPSIV